MATTRNTTKKTTAKPAEKAKETAAAENAVEKEAAALKEQNDFLMKQLAEIRAELDAAKKPQIIQLADDTAKVNFLWQAEVADDNVQVFGEGGIYGNIVGKTGTFSVPKSQLSRLMTAMNRMFIDRRWLIVLDGLDDAEREMMGVNYKEGELLDRQAFAKMVELGDQMLEIYPLLCDSHKEIVSKRYHEAYMNGDPHVTREIIVELSKLAKKAGRGDDFRDIIEDMNAADAE